MNLAAQNINLAYVLSHKARKKFPPHVEFDDIVGYAMIGLCEAAKRFDVSRGLKFSTYAYPRVWGAIMDGVKSMHRKDANTEQLGDYMYELPNEAIEEILDMEPIKQAIERLPEAQREALRVQHGISHKCRRLRNKAIKTLRVMLAA